MADVNSPIRDYDIIISRNDSKFRARIAELGLAASADTAEAAIAELNALHKDYMAAATRAGVADSIPNSAPSQPSSRTNALSPLTPVLRTIGTQPGVVAVGGDSYLRFFLKSLIAAAVFIVSFGAASLIGVYLVGNSLINIAADAVDARLSHLTKLDLDVVSTGLVDTTSRVASYIQRVPPERQLELEKNLHFIASQMAPYLREIVVPLSGAFAETDPPAASAAAPVAPGSGRASPTPTGR